uniref:Uncharacterized protein n=1 Tax=Arundo donax TaxID=35708 RepID=A0A0A9ERC4_ARUDO
MAANAGSVSAAAPPPVMPAAPTESRVLSARFLALSVREKVARRRAWSGSAGSSGALVVGCTASAE